MPRPRPLRSPMHLTQTSLACQDCFRNRVPTAARSPSWSRPGATRLSRSITSRTVPKPSTRQYGGDGTAEGSAVSTAFIAGCGHEPRQRRSVGYGCAPVTQRLHEAPRPHSPPRSMRRAADSRAMPHRPVFPTDSSRPEARLARAMRCTVRELRANHSVPALLPVLVSSQAVTWSSF